MLNWAGETTLDVEYAHAMAPDANILLVETPVAETEGVTGLPEIVAAENYVINHNLADVITQSFGATEETFPSKQSLLDLRSAFINAAAHGVTVLASSGDNGATSQILDGSADYPMPGQLLAFLRPAGDQHRRHPAAPGRGRQPDCARMRPGTTATVPAVVASARCSPGRPTRTGFARSSVATAVRPDISASAAVDGAAIFYYSFDPTFVGWHLVGGTSEASPLFSGIVALTAQLAHHKLGQINPALYTLNALHANGIVDVTIGDNSFAGVTGYPATKGYDLATGVGTFDGARFVPQLALASVFHAGW